MSLDYHLSPDSPLLRPDAAERVFGNPEQYAFHQQIEDMHELEFSLEQIYTKKRVQEMLAWPVYSVLTQEEIAELLTPAGTVWVLCQAMGLDIWEASRLYEAGIPWPLRSHYEGLQWASGFLTQEQIDYLDRLFRPVERQGQIIIELENNGWEAPNQPDGGPVKQARAYWKEIAKETNEDIQMVRRAALALYRYYEYAENFVKQQGIDAYRLDGGQDLMALILRQRSNL